MYSSYILHKILEVFEPVAGNLSHNNGHNAPRCAALKTPILIAGVTLMVACLQAGKKEDSTQRCKTKTAKNFIRKSWRS